ncbi:MAG: GNAT family N-acetyltransferase [Paracoccaceae bacterium]
MTSIPTLETERLILRAPCAQDWAGYLDFFTGPRAKIFGTLKTKADAKNILDAQCTHWQKHRLGPYVVHVIAENRAIGVVGVGLPKGTDEPELTWSIWRDEDEGKGYAFEAAKAARVDYFNKKPKSTLVSYIDPRNTRSVSLAKRLDCKVDAIAKAPFEAGVTYRHSAPEAVQ